MSTITVTRTLNHSAHTLWSVLADFGGVHKYAAGVESSPINVGTPSQGVGSERYCNLYDGNHLQERVIESVANRRLLVDVFESSMPLKSFGGLWELEELKDGRTQVTVTADYVVKFGILGKALDALVMRTMMVGNLNGMLAGLNEHVETGAIIGKGWTEASAGAKAAGARQHA